MSDGNLRSKVSEVGSSFGDDYAQWKGWGAANFGAIHSRQRRYFHSVLRQVLPLLPSPASVLEVGYGNGTFLRYCAEIGLPIVGLEANPALVKFGLDAGFNCRLAENLDGIGANSCDLIAAFDVLEHLPKDALPAFFASAHRVLSASGMLVVRFPNGDSPLSLPYQNGDLTHLTAIGSLAIRELSRRSGFTIVRIAGDEQPLRPESIGSVLAGAARRLLRLLINAVVNALYFRPEKIDFVAPNLLVILIKDRAARPG